MNHPMQTDDAVIDWLVKQAVEGLSPDEKAALDAAARDLDAARVAAELRQFEQAAAAVSMTGLDTQAALPAGLRQKLQRDAENLAAGLRTQPVVIVPDAGAGAGPAAVAPAARSRTAFANSGWWAAAACLVLAVFFAVRGPQPLLPPTAVQMRAQLLARADSVRIAWSPTKDPGGNGVSGDLVWNPALQSGVMRFVGLAPNRPTATQYQLWIFDAERDERYPVDGGVFDVPAGAREVLVPIHAAVPVRNAKLFAVTVEKPGGVVVSQRERIVVTAAPG